jgi:hypothetical protein
MTLPFTLYQPNEDGISEIKSRRPDAIPVAAAFLSLLTRSVKAASPGDYQAQRSAPGTAVGLSWGLAGKSWSYYANRPPTPQEDFPALRPTALALPQLVPSLADNGVGLRLTLPLEETTRWFYDVDADRPVREGLAAVGAVVAELR